MALDGKIAIVTGAAGDAELVNYRVQGRYMVVDRLFAAAELRLGDKRSEQRVRIVRDGAAAESAGGWVGSGPVESPASARAVSTPKGVAAGERMAKA